jgi:hypothetical protein
MARMGREGGPRTAQEAVTALQSLMARMGSAVGKDNVHPLYKLTLETLRTKAKAQGRAAPTGR